MVRVARVGGPRRWGYAEQQAYERNVTNRQQQRDAFFRIFQACAETLEAPLVSTVHTSCPYQQLDRARAIHRGAYEDESGRAHFYIHYNFVIHALF